VVPLHTDTLDVANLGILMDWALQQEHYLMGWGIVVDMGQNPWHPGADTYPFRQNLLEEYYSKLYGNFWNMSAVTYYRADGQRFDFDFNPHWSAHGHAVAAEAVFDALRARGWLTPCCAGLC
jgi:hypothetical protein